MLSNTVSAVAFAIRTLKADLTDRVFVWYYFPHVPGKPQYWPKSIFANGHVLVDTEKMSKSKGNFMTMEQACAKWSADVVRLTQADAGDTLEDAGRSGCDIRGSSGSWRPRTATAGQYCRR